MDWIPHVGMDVLLAEAMLGLFRAIGTYQPEHAFSTFASRHIKWALSRFGQTERRWHGRYIAAATFGRA